MDFIEMRDNGKPVLIPLANIAKIEPSYVPPRDGKPERGRWWMSDAEREGKRTTIHFRKAAGGDTSVDVDYTFEEVKQALAEAGHRLLPPPEPV